MENKSLVPVSSKKPEVSSFVTTRRGAEGLFLEYVNECIPKECPFVDKCGFLKGDICGFEGVFYMKLVKFLLGLEARGKISGSDFTHVSICILPLYRQLMGLYKEEVRLKGRMFTYNKKGEAERMHPVYGEIRKVLSAIGTMWKGVNLDGDKMFGGYGLRDRVYKFAEN